MDEFQRYLLDRINFYNQILHEEKDGLTISTLDEAKKSRIWSLDNALTELVGVFCDYEVNYKV